MNHSSPREFVHVCATLKPQDLGITFTVETLRPTARLLGKGRTHRGYRDVTFEVVSGQISEHRWSTEWLKPNGQS